MSRDLHPYCDPDSPPYSLESPTGDGAAVRMIDFKNGLLESEIVRTRDTWPEHWRGHRKDKPMTAIFDPERDNSPTVAMPNVQFVPGCTTAVTYTKVPPTELETLREQLHQARMKIVSLEERLAEATNRNQKARHQLIEAAMVLEGIK